MVRTLFSFLLFCIPFSLSAQTVSLTRLTGPITLDGITDEAAWQHVDPVPLTMYQPQHEGDMTERTEIRIGYDDSYLYVSSQMYDAEPQGIRANSLYRDRYSGDDTFALILDTFNDNETALWFFITPTGVRLDWLVFNDAEFLNGPPFNESWNTYWDVETVVTEEGWFAELRIPFSSLGFQDIDGRVEMGLITYRYISRKSERHIFPNIPPNWNFGFCKPSQAQDVVLEGVYSQKPVYITPYAIGGVGQNALLNTAGTGYRHDGDTNQDIGLDVKYNVTNNLTLDVTVNTDFAQVEADDQQVNLGRFSLFFPEKRQFFQERSGIFDFRTGFLDRLFYSRIIGLNQGQVIPILGGTRLVGRVGSWDVGLLDMQTGRSDALPSENFGVVRLRRQVFNPFSYAGGLITSRLGDDGSYNVAYGLDGVFRVTGNEYLQVKWAQSFEDDLLRDDPLDFFEAGMLNIQWQRRTLVGFNYGATFTRSGRDYTPGMGFITRRDFMRISGSANLGYLGSETSRFRTYSYGVSAGVFYRNVDQSVQSSFVSLPYSAQFKSDARLFVTPSYAYEDLRFDLPLPNGVFVPVGNYSFATVNVNYIGSSETLLRTDATAQAGSYYDGWRSSASVSPTWNLSKHLELGGTYQLDLLRFPDRDASLDLHIVRFRIRTALNTKLSANLFFQYSNAADLVTSNLRLRYNFREGNDLWLVYNEGMNLDRDRTMPSLPFTDNRTLLLKYTHTFAR